jgi:hypothetical protein
MVAINYRLVDAETSEVVATGQERGESKRTSKSWGAGANGSTVGMDVTAANFAETIVGEATMDCVNKLADIFTKQVQGMTRKRHALEAYVADISANTMVITAGTNDGVVPGDVFEICKIDRVLRDPNTKEVLDRVVTKAVNAPSVACANGSQQAPIPAHRRKTDSGPARNCSFVGLVAVRLTFGGTFS